MGNGNLTRVDIGRLPVSYFRPENGVSFSPSNYVALGAIGTDTVIVSFTVPNGFDGVINEIANNLVGGGFTDGSGSVIWRLKQNDGFVRNFQAILAALGTPVAPSTIAPINVYEGDLIQLIGSNISLGVAGQLLGGRLGGWYYPREAASSDVWY